MAYSAAATYLAAILQSVVHLSTQRHVKVVARLLLQTAQDKHSRAVKHAAVNRQQVGWQADLLRAGGAQG